MLIKEKFKVGCLIRCHNKSYETVPRLVIGIHEFRDKYVVYDALIVPSKKIFYTSLISAPDVWYHVE